MRGTTYKLAAILFITISMTFSAHAVDQILFSVTADNAVYTANLDGSGTPSTLVSPAATVSYGPTGMFTDFANNLIYIAGGNSGDVSVAPLTGGAASSLANSNVGASHRDVYVDAVNSRYFFTTNDVNGVWVAASDGSGSATQVYASGASLSSPHGLEYDAASGNLYLTDIFGGIYSLNAATGVSTLLHSTSGGPRGLAIDVSAGKIYWTEFGGGSNGIYSGNLDGSGSAVLLYTVPSPYRPHGIFVDYSTQVLYWAEFQQFSPGSRIMTATADGSGSPSVLHDLPSAVNLRGIEFGQPIVVAPPTGVPTLSQWGLIIFGLLLLCSGAVTMWRRQYQLGPQAA